MLIVAWILTALDILASAALVLSGGILASVFWSSHVSTDQTIGVGILIASLVIASHSGIGIWLCLKKPPIWASIYSGLFVALTGGGVFVSWALIEAAVRP